MTLTKTSALLVALLKGAGCSGSSSNGSTSTGTSESDVTAYQQLVDDTDSAAASYRGSMMSPGATHASCPAMHDQYDAQVRPWIEEMMQRAGGMDDFMDAHGGMMSADMSCIASAMMSELDHHRAVACSFSSLDDDRTEAARHVDAMMGYGGHASERCGEIERGMHDGDWSWGSMMGGCDDTHHDGYDSGWMDSGMMYGDGTTHGDGMMGGH